jgi:hypothetical protein
VVTHQRRRIRSSSRNAPNYSICTADGLTPLTGINVQDGGFKKSVIKSITWQY